MKLLVIGSGGREHALVWKLAQSPHVTQMWCTPGNAGIAEERLAKHGALVECVPLPAEDLPKLLAFAQQERPDFTVVGPDNPLAAGIVDDIDGVCAAGACIPAGCGNGLLEPTEACDDGNREDRGDDHRRAGRVLGEPIERVTGFVIGRRREGKDARDDRAEERQQNDGDGHISPSSS